MTRVAALIGLAACAGSAVTAELPEPEPSFPASERTEELVLAGDRFVLPATLELPAAGAPVPCAVFFAGSGPTDRDWRSRLSDSEPIGKLLAEGLRDAQIGSLRFDKVGSPRNRGAVARLSLDHFRDEGVLAFEHLDDLPECDRVFLLGASEGAIHALRTAGAKIDDPTLGGVIAIDPPAQPLIDDLLDQIWADRLRRDPDVDREALAQLLSNFRYAAANSGDSATIGGLEALARLWRALNHPENSRVARELLFVDPLAVAARFNGPALVVSSGPDNDVSAAVVAALGNARHGALRRREVVDSIGGMVEAIAAFVRAGPANVPPKTTTRTHQ